MAKVALDVRVAQSFDSMTTEGQAGVNHGWLNGDMPLADAYPRIAAVADAVGMPIQAYLRDEVTVASERQAGDEWVLRSGFYKKAIGAYIIATLGVDAKEAVKLAAGYTLGWAKVSKTAVTNTLDDIDTMSKGQLIDAVDANLASRVRPKPGRADLAKALRAGKYNLGSALDDILALLEL